MTWNAATATVLAQLEQWWIEHPASHARLPHRLTNLLKTLELPGFDTNTEKVYALKNGLTVRPCCTICGSRVNFIGRFLSTCSIQCAGKDPSRKKAIERTNLERYGHKSPMSNPAVRARAQATVQARYGVMNSAQAPEVIGRIRATNMKRYGVPCTLNTIENTTLKKDTWLAKYGVENPAQAAGPTSKTQMALHARKIVEKNQRVTDLTELGYTALFETWEGADTEYSWRHEVCGTKFEHHFIGNIVPRCPTCAPRNTSAEERIVWNILTELGVVFTTNDRSIISPLELDIFVKDRQLAIEVNGAYWHHDQGSLRPLLEKTQLAAQAGVELLHFWAHEINENLPAVRSIIMAKLGLHPRRQARKLEIKPLRSADAASFLKTHHLAGHARAKIYLALVDKKQVVAVASFAPNRFQKNSTWELVRFASEGSVAGGLSRLMAAFHRQVTAPLVSFADARYSTGKAYLSVGFEALGKTKPNYFYMKGSRRLHRQQAMKYKLPTLLDVFDPALTEYQNMTNNGWFRCSDCGSYKFILNPPKTSA